MLLSFVKGILSRASVSSASSVSSVVLGRWGIQYDPKIIRIKIDQANEDNCGCCIEEPATVSKPPANPAKTTKTRYEKIEEYLLPYVM
jgi:hypothetical protein